MQPRPKTEAGWRVIAVPAFAVEMIRRRAWALVPCSPPRWLAGRATRTTSRATSGCSSNPSSAGACRQTGYQLDADGEFVQGSRGQRFRCDLGPWSWVTSHTFRKTVATRLDEAGFTARQVADQLGHAVAR